MKNNLVCCFLGGLLVAPFLAFAQSPALTYQGRLFDGRRAANGIYELQFGLADALIEGAYVGPKLTNSEVEVSNGLFTVSLDFGSGIFDGTPLWLEIGVRRSGSTDPYTLLVPRQALTAAPYATFAASAASLTGSATNTTVFGSLSLAGMGTNVVLCTTNKQVVTTSPDSNLIFVNGAGVAAANGTYWLRTATPAPYYTNRTGMVILSAPDDPDYQWQLRKASGKLLYGSLFWDISQITAWQVVEPAAAPRPSFVSFGTNYFTNSSTQLLMGGAPVPAPSLGNDIYVNAAIGNDLFAERGHPDLPYKTVYAALQAATNNDTVIVSPGVYNERSFIMTLPTGLKLIGAGRRVTSIYCHPSSSVPAGNLDLSSSNVLSSFTTDFVISVGGYGVTLGTATNALLENLEVSGISDVIYLQSWQGFTAINCSFTSKSDCFVDFQTDPAGTNAIAELYNCHLKTTGSGILSNHGIVNGGQGQLRMFGGSIEARNTQFSACVWSPRGTAPGGSIEISGVALSYGTTNTAGRAFAILNESGTNCSITVKGMLLKTSDVSGPVIYEGNLYTTNLVDEATAPAPGIRATKR
jgi:hypothetical protein